METNVTTARTMIEAVDGSGIQAAALVGGGVIRQGYGPPYANPPVSNYRKFWYSNGAASWAGFRVLSRGRQRRQPARLESGDPAGDGLPGGGLRLHVHCRGDDRLLVRRRVPGRPDHFDRRERSRSKLRASSGRVVRPVACALTGPLNATLASRRLPGGRQSGTRLLVKTKVEIAMAPGEAGEVRRGDRPLPLAGGQLRPGLERT